MNQQVTGALPVMIAVLVACVSLPVCAAGPPLDDYGGYTALKSRLHPDGTGRYELERIDGRWWFITPEGNVQHSLGVNWVKIYTQSVDGQWPYRDLCREKYGGDAQWADAQVARMKGWGFSVLSYVHPRNSNDHADRIFWAKQKMPYIVRLRTIYYTMRDYSLADVWQGTAWTPFPDVFDPAFADAVDGRYRMLINDYDYNADPYCMGFLTDEERGNMEYAVRQGYNNDRVKEMIATYGEMAWDERGDG